MVNGFEAVKAKIPALIHRLSRRLANEELRNFTFHGSGCRESPHRAVVRGRRWHVDLTGVRDWRSVRNVRASPIILPATCLPRSFVALESRGGGGPAGGAPPSASIPHGAE